MRTSRACAGSTKGESRSKTTRASKRSLAGEMWFGGALTLFVIASVACTGATAPSIPCDSSVSDACWQFLGPEQTSVVAVLSANNTVLVGTQAGGVLRRAPNGAWVQDGLTCCGVTGMATDRSGNLWASANANAPSATSSIAYVREGRWDSTLIPGTAWRAADGGIAAANDYNAHACSISVSPSRPGVVTVGLSGSIVQTLDGGQSWRFVAGTSTTIGLGVFAIFESDILGSAMYAAMGNGADLALLLKSNDGGTTWSTSAPFGLGGPPATLDVLAPSAEPGAVLLGVPGEVARSADGGATWVSTLSLPRVGSVFRIATAGESALLALASVVTEDGVRDSLAVFRTDDLGRTWHSLGTPSRASGARSWARAQDGALLIGTSGGLWRRTSAPP